MGWWFCWWVPGSIKPISTAMRAYHSPPSPPHTHFTSLVINDLCQCSEVIGRTSWPVKRLISMLLCGWLKAMINNVMAFTEDSSAAVCCNQGVWLLSLSTVMCILYITVLLQRMCNIIYRSNSTFIHPTYCILYIALDVTVELNTV